MGYLTGWKIPLPLPSCQNAYFTPNPTWAETKVPDATPGIIAKYAFTDEQALLAKLRYNRLIDIFTGVTCYSLQNHLRTTVRGIGQVETDEVYVGVDKRGVHYVFPVQGKRRGDRLSVVQIWQDIELCREKFADVICRSVGAQFMADDLIAMFEFERRNGAEDELDISIVSEKHYHLVPPEAVTPEELFAYRTRTD